jgi:hypothetical protein
MPRDRPAHGPAVNNFFQELAKKLAERWVAVLLLPGLLLAAAAWASVHLGHSLAVPQLTRAAADLGKVFARQPGGVQALLVAALLLVSTGAGLAVQALAPLMRLIWLGRWPVLQREGTVRRRARWYEQVDERRRLTRNHPVGSRTQDQQRLIDEAAGRANRIALAEPGRPTWMGDRISAVEQIAFNRYGLDLTFAWPRLWLVLPDQTRAELNTAHSAFAAAVITGTWAWPYLLLGLVCWPAALAGVVAGAAGWAQARTAVADMTALSEATLDLHLRALALALGVGDPAATGPISFTEGETINALIRKGR